MDKTRRGRFTTLGPGRADRDGLSLPELFAMFPDDATAEQWFEDQRWPDGERFCPDCGSERYSIAKNRKPMPYRCKDCRRYFSVRKGTVMQSSKLGLQKWAIAIYMMATNLKGVSSMRIHRDLGIDQRAAWHMMQRIREAFVAGDGLKMPGPVEVDETFMGGKDRNKHASKRQGRQGTRGKTPVIGAKDRSSNQVKAAVIEGTDRRTLHDFIGDTAEPGAQVYTDDHPSYDGMPFPHASVKHSAKEYVHGQAHTNGIESFWALLKRGHNGVFHKMSTKHLHRYVNEFAGRNNIRDLDTVDQMSAIAQGMVGRRLRYRDLTA